MGRGEIARNEQFLLFRPFRKVSAMLIKFEIVVCKLFQFGRVQNLLFGKGLSNHEKESFGNNLAKGENAGN